MSKNPYQDEIEKLEGALFLHESNLERGKYVRESEAKIAEIRTRLNEIAELSQELEP